MGSDYRYSNVLHKEVQRGIRDARGVSGKAKVKVQKDWLLVYFDTWLQPDDPRCSVWGEYKDEATARLVMDKSIITLYVCHRDVYNKIKPYWRH